MVEAFSLRTAHLYGDALASQAHLRYRVFVKQRGLEHSYYEELEYDQFDTPGAVYFVWRDDTQVVRGLIRLLPTTLPYMLQSFWPHLAGGHVPRSRSVWEVTRLCVDREFHSTSRHRIMPEIMCGVHEFCVANNITHVVGVTRKHLIEYFLREGVKWLGPTAVIEGEPEAAFSVPLKYMRPRYHCERLGITDSCLNIPITQLIAA